MSLYEDENLDRMVYFIDYEELTIEEMSLAALCYGYAQTMDGDWVYYVKGSSLWEKRLGGRDHLLETFETVEKAEHAQLLLFKDDLLNNPNAPYIFSNRKDAESELLEYKEASGRVLN